MHVTFDDVAVYLTEEEWRNLNGRQLQLYMEVMNENYASLQSLGLPVPESDLLHCIEGQKWKRRPFSEAKEQPYAPPQTDKASYGLGEMVSLMSGSTEGEENGCEPSNPNPNEKVLEMYQQQNSLASFRKEMLRNSSLKPKCHACNGILRCYCDILKQKRKKPYVCEDCGKAYGLQLYLLLHRKSHFQEHFYKCPLCEKSFDKSKVLRKHMRTHQETAIHLDSQSKFTEMPPDTRQKGTGTPPGIWQKDTGTPPGIWQKDTGTPPGIWQKDTGTPPGIWQKGTGTPPGIWQKDTGTPPGIWQKDAGTPPDIWQKDTGTSPDTLPKATGTPPDIWQKDTGTSPDTLPKAIGMPPDTQPKSIAMPPDTQRKATVTPPDTQRKATVTPPNIWPKATMTQWVTQKAASHGCEQCQAVFPSKKLLKIHSRNHKKVKTHSCLICGQIVQTYTELNMHLKGHKKPYECSVCGKIFTNRPDFIVHLREHSGEQMYKCNVCMKGYSLLSRFIKHMTVHLSQAVKINNVKLDQPSLPGEKRPEHRGTMNPVFQGLSQKKEKLAAMPFNFYPSSLKANLNTEKEREQTWNERHVEFKPFKKGKRVRCKKCKKGFRYRESLRRHRESHQVRFVCHQCGKGFRKLVKLYLHRRVHQTYRPYMCKHCTKTFRYRSLLILHLNTHDLSEIGSRYPCAYCRKVFRSQANCLLHQKTHIYEPVSNATESYLATFSNIQIAPISDRKNVEKRPLQETPPSKQYVKQLSYRPCT